MPFANTGLASPNNFTDSAGVFDYSSGTVTTTLAGKYVRVSDTCGAVSSSSTTGNVQTWAAPTASTTAPPAAAGRATRPASRSAFYEVNGLPSWPAAGCPATPG